MDDWAQGVITQFHNVNELISEVLDGKLEKGQKREQSVTVSEARHIFEKEELKKWTDSQDVRFLACIAVVVAFLLTKGLKRVRDCKAHKALASWQASEMHTHPLIACHCAQILQRFKESSCTRAPKMVLAGLKSVKATKFRSSEPCRSLVQP